MFWLFTFLYTLNTAETQSPAQFLAFPRLSFQSVRVMHFSPPTRLPSKIKRLRNVKPFNNSKLLPCTTYNEMFWTDTPSRAELIIPRISCEGWRHQRVGVAIIVVKAEGLNLNNKRNKRIHLLIRAFSFVARQSPLEARRSRYYFWKRVKCRGNSSYLSLPTEYASTGTRVSFIPHSYWHNICKHILVFK